MIQEHNTHLNSFATQSQEALNAIKTEGMQEIRTEAQRLLEQIKNNTTALDQNVTQEYETWLLNLQNKGQEAQNLIQEGINTTIPNALQDFYRARDEERRAYTKPRHTKRKQFRIYK